MSWALTCECVYTCAEDPNTACPLSGQWHMHHGLRCPIHPDAPIEWPANQLRLPPRQQRTTE